MMISQGQTDVRTDISHYETALLLKNDNSGQIILFLT